MKTSHRLGAIFATISICWGLCTGDETFRTQATLIDSDDYCDLDTGGDEPFSSACSHMGQLFQCESSGSREVVTIPSSRVSDGICDCCDGSDEKYSPFQPNCSYTCDSDLVLLKRESLEWYRSVQVGIRTQQDLTYALKSKKRKEIKALEKLVEERYDIQDLYYKMKVLLRENEKREEELRFQLLRERENRCAMGYADACNYFHSDYFDEDELVHSGYPLEWAKPKQRLKFQHNDTDIEYLSKLSGIERVRLSLCPARSLLPDDDSRIYTRVGEYVSYATSEGARAVKQRKPVNQMRKKTLLGPILENGQKGVLLFGCLTCETLGMVLSPVIGLLHLAYDGYQHTTAKVLTRVQDTCATIGDADGTSANVCKVVAKKSKVRHDDDEGGLSAPSSLLDVFDYERYEAIAAVVEYISLSPLRIIPWATSVAWRAPRMYYDYYIDVKGTQLPPHRRACLLRNGIESAKNEIAKIEKHLEEAEELRMLMSTKRNSKEASQQELFDDFGPDNVWEPLLDLCINATFSQYAYKICFFEQITQAQKTSLGAFVGWGKFGDSTPASSVGRVGHTAKRNGVLSENPSLKNKNKKRSTYLDDDDDDDDQRSSEFSVYLQYLSSGIWFVYDTLIEMLYAARNAADYMTDMPMIRLVRQRRGRGRGRAKGGSSNDNSKDDSEGEYDWMYDLLLTESPEAAVTHLKDTNGNVYSKYNFQRYEDGTKCQVLQNTKRKTLVEFKCASANQLIDVTEIETCYYHMLVNTPMACTKDLEDGALQRLEDLGVFGFSKTQTSSSDRKSKKKK